MALHEESLIGYSSSNLGTSEASLKNAFRLLILGAPKVGKTSIVNWFLGKAYRDNYIPTIEDFHRKIYKIRGDIYRLDILDTSGNDPFPAMKKLNIMIGDIFILVFSIDDIDSYLQVKSLCEQIIELKRHHNKQESRQNAKLNVPILIIGNKLDFLLENKIVKRCVELNDIERFISSFKSSMYFETSCKTRMGLDRAFEKFFYQTNLPIEMIPSKHRKVSLNLDLTKSQFPKHLHTSQEDEIVEQQSIQTPNEVDHQQTPNKELLNDGAANTLESSSSPPLDSNAPSVQTNGSNSSQHYRHSRNGSFKNAARKSLRKMTFRRHLNEAYGAVWLNARRPSIRAELNLLQVKTDSKFHLPTKKPNYNDNKSIYKKPSNMSRLLCCKRGSNQINKINKSKPLKGNNRFIPASNLKGEISNNNNNNNKTVNINKKDSNNNKKSSCNIL